MVKGGGERRMGLKPIDSMPVCFGIFPWLYSLRLYVVFVCLKPAEEFFFFFCYFSFECKTVLKVE